MAQTLIVGKGCTCPHCHKPLPPVGIEESPYPAHELTPVWSLLQPKKLPRLSHYHLFLLAHEGASYQERFLMRQVVALSMTRSTEICHAKQGIIPDLSQYLAKPRSKHLTGEAFMEAQRLMGWLLNRQEPEARRYAGTIALTAGTPLTVDPLLGRWRAS